MGAKEQPLNTVKKKVEVSTMDVQETVAKAADAMNVKRVFGDPIEHGELVVIPAAKVRCGAGGGRGPKPDGVEAGTGSAFRITASPVGAFVFKNGKVRWKPAIDINRVILGGQLIVLVALLTFGRILVRRLR